MKVKKKGEGSVECNSECYRCQTTTSDEGRERERKGKLMCFKKKMKNERNFGWILEWKGSPHLDLSSTLLFSYLVLFWYG
jgi:hypothetical protein